MEEPKKHFKMYKVENAGLLLQSLQLLPKHAY